MARATGRYRAEERSAVDPMPSPGAVTEPGAYAGRSVSWSTTLTPSWSGYSETDSQREGGRRARKWTGSSAIMAAR